MKEVEEEGPKSTAIVMDEGCFGNSFIGMDISGFETIVDMKEGASGNQFIGGNYRRHPDQAAVHQLAPEAPSQSSDSTPWYRQIVIQVAAAVIGALILGALYWFGLPH